MRVLTAIGGWHFFVVLLAATLAPFALAALYDKSVTQENNAVVDSGDGDLTGPMPAGSLPHANGLPQTAGSWDAPVVTVEREETVHGAIKHPMDDDHSFQHVQDSDHEQIEKNYVIDATRPSIKANMPTMTTESPSSASRVSAAGAVAFTVALLLILEM